LFVCLGLMMPCTRLVIGDWLFEHF